MSAVNVVQRTPAAALPSHLEVMATHTVPAPAALASASKTTKTAPAILAATNSASTTSTTTTTITTTPSTTKRLRDTDHVEGRITKIRPAAFTKNMDPPVVSFYTRNVVPLPSRFRNVKQRVIKGHEDAVEASWGRLLKALREEVERIETRGPELIPSIDFSEIDSSAHVDPFSDKLKRHGIGIIRGVVPHEDASVWVRETKEYLETKHEFKAPPAQDPTCFDFFWTPAQVRARAHPNVLQAQRFAMSLWDTGDDDRLATRFPITYADRIRIESISDGTMTVNGNMIPATPEDSLIAAAAATSSAQIAQVDNGSLERWEPDGYGRAGLYDAIWKGEWEAWNPWDPAGRINATPDLYNGAGACSMMRLFQGILALTVVEPGMIKLLPSPKLSTVYFLLRPFFSPREPAPEAGDGPEKWEAYLDAANWSLDKEQSTIIHGAVPGHAQRVTEFWHPHLHLDKSLIAPPTLQPGDYIVWHPETAYQFSNTNYLNNGRPATSSSEGPRTSMLVYTPAAPLSQTNALFLARQRKAFLRGHPGPDFDSTGTGLGSEAPHTGRLGEKEIREVGGEEGLQAMGLAPFNLGRSVKNGSASLLSVEASLAKERDRDGEKEDEGRSLTPNTHSEVEVLKLANVILFPERYEFYMPTRAPSRASSPLPTGGGSRERDKERDREKDRGVKNGAT